MFGVIRGDGFRLNCGEQRAWMGHVCGMCLALGQSSGQVARLATNYDAALLSVLYEALLPVPVPRKTHYCPLRAGRWGEVIAPTSPGARYAASIALVSAATKIRDHVADRDGVLRFWPGLFRRLAAWWLRAGRYTARSLGFRTEVIETQTDRQPAVEAEPGRDFSFYAGPTEESVGAACRHVAVLAGCPEQAGALDRIGRLFGRIMYLLDAYLDYADDLARHQFNPLARCFAPHEVRRRTRALFAQAHGEIKDQFERLALPNPTLARRLLIDQLARAARAALGEETEGGAAEPPPGEEEAGKKKVKRPEVRLRKKQADSANAAACDPGTGLCAWTLCDPDCGSCLGDLLCFGCDASFPDCSDVGCGDLCGNADACSGCDISCN